MIADTIAVGTTPVPLATDSRSASFLQIQVVAGTITIGTKVSVAAGKGIAITGPGTTWLGGGSSQFFLADIWAVAAAAGGSLSYLGE